METYKRKVPAGIRPTAGHVPSTVFNQDSIRNENGYSNSTSVYIEERKSQRRAQNQLRHEEKMRDLEMLNSYNPWGKPGGGAPRNSGPHMMKLEKSLNDSNKADGSLVEYMSRPGGGAPLRSENGDAIGVVRVHPDIRNNREQLNEETKKKTVLNGVAKPFYEDSEPRFHKSQFLGGREKTSEEMKNNLKERLNKQVDEKRASMQIEKEDRNTPSDTDWMNGKVGYIQRNSSGKIARSEPLAQRGADGIREYYDERGDKSIVEQLGRPGPGVAVRTESGKVHAQPRGGPRDNDDPFRPGLNNKSPANQVFPVDIEDEAKERAWKRHPAKSPPFNKHSIENGYYIDPDKVSEHSAHASFNGHNGNDKQIGTVYSAVLRTKGNYLEDLRQQITEKQVMKERERKESLDQDFQHIRSSDIFGRPGNGAPRLKDGSLKTTRNKLEELETLSDSLRQPGAFRGLH
ncbi:hypothetical protein ACHWQZ_G018879 [Mnemiopsis leidyi]